MPRSIAHRLLPALLVMGAGVLPRPAHAQISLALPQNYKTAYGAYGIASADMNKDGRMDLVVANQSSSNVSVLLNAGGGTFAPAISFPVGNRPSAVIVADFNRDGIPDVAAVNGSDNSVSVLFGTGNGSLLPATNYPVGSLPNSIATADLNGDGAPDLVLTNQSSNTITVLYNLGAGTFGNAATLSTGAGPRSVVLADLNLDGRPDILCADQMSGTLSVFVNDGPGAVKSAPSVFEARRALTVPSSGGIAVGDFDGDGRPDIASADYGDAYMQVLIGHGDGTFSAPVAVPAGGNFAAGIAITDLNNDRRPDLAITNSGNGTLSVLLGNGDGTFQDPITEASGTVHNGMAFADLNGDRLPDLVVSNVNPNGTLSVYLNTTSSISSVTFDIPGAPPSIEAGHFSVATVTLSAPAAPGGSVLTLSSQNPAIAYVSPAPIIIEEGNTSATFIVGARTVGDSILTATLNGVSANVPVHVKAPTTGTTGTVRGDANGDGVVNSADAILILKWLGGIESRPAS